MTKQHPCGELERNANTYLCLFSALESLKFSTRRDVMIVFIHMSLLLKIWNMMLARSNNITALSTVFDITKIETLNMKTSTKNMVVT